MKLHKHHLAESQVQQRPNGRSPCSSSSSIVSSSRSDEQVSPLSINQLHQVKQSATSSRTISDPEQHQQEPCSGPSKKTRAVRTAWQEAQRLEHTIMQSFAPSSSLHELDNVRLEARSSSSIAPNLALFDLAKASALNPVTRLQQLPQTSGSSVNVLVENSFQRQSSTSNRTASSPRSSITTNVPTYETIDVHKLNEQQPSGYRGGNGTLEYCSSSAESGQSAASGCALDQCSTAPIMASEHEQHLYRAILLGRSSGAGYLCRNGNMFRAYPQARCDQASYYSLYGANHVAGCGQCAQCSVVHLNARQSGQLDYQNEPHLYDEQESTCTTPEFDISSAIFALISLTAYLVGVAASVVLAYFYHRHEQNVQMCAFTLAATLIPSLLVNILSLKWSLSDNHRQQRDPDYPAKRPEIGPCGWTFRILLHILLLGPALRYVELLRFGVKSWSEQRKMTRRQELGDSLWGSGVLPSLSASLTGPRLNEGLAYLHANQKSEKSKKRQKDEQVNYYLLTVYEDRDSSLLSLFRTLVQCSVQMVAQICSLPMLHKYEQQHIQHEQSSATRRREEWSEDNSHSFTENVQMAVVTCCLLELAWSLASYNRSLRRASIGKRIMSVTGVVLQFLWHMGTVGSRLVAVALFISQFGAWLVPVSIAHWGVMSVWIMHQGAHSMHEPHQLTEYLFNMLVGAIYLLQLLNVNDEPTRYKYTSYYIIVGAQNVTLTVLWLWRVAQSPPQLPHLWASLPALALVAILFVTGILAMQLYYWCAHPSGHSPRLKQTQARCC